MLRLRSFYMLQAKINTVLLLAAISYGFMGCNRLFSYTICKKLEKSNKKLIAGKETYGLKNVKYRKQSRKTLCYYKR